MRDIVDKWQIHGSLGEVLHERAIEWLAENGLPAIQDLPYNQIATDLEFDQKTTEFVVIVHTPWAP